MIKKVLISNLSVFLLLSFSGTVFSQIPTKVFEITNILVDGCDGSNEGKNEMVLFQIGPNPVNVVDIRVDGAGSTNIIDTAVWPNINNPWLEIASPPAKPVEVAQINATTTNCGYLKEPIGGILPAGKKVLLITSTDFNPAAHSFVTLGDTLYIIFQNANNTSGHFVNYGTPSSFRTLVLHHRPTGGADTVVYDRSLLVNQLGIPGAQDGASVMYTFGGIATYNNPGCQAPYTPLNASWTIPASMCQSSPLLDLTTLITGSTGGTWSGSGVTGYMFNPSGLSGNIAVTYTVGSVPCASSVTHNIQVISAGDAAWNGPATICESAASINLNVLITGTTGGTWSGNGVTGSTFNPAGLSGNISITYSVGITPCNDSESHIIQVLQSANASWTNPGTVCISDPPIDLGSMITGNIGGAWSGTGITNSSTGLFDPVVSGTGTFQIIYSISGSCGDADTALITVTSMANATINPVGSFCSGDSPVLLTAADPGGIWSGTGISNTSTGQFSPSVAGAGTFEIIYVISGNCGNSDTTSINVLLSPDVIVSVTAETCMDSADGSAVVTPVNLINSYTYLWNNLLTDTLITFLAAGQYVVTVTDTNGCSVSRSVQVLASSEPCYLIDPVIFVPNVFSPNGDGINDVLFVRGQGIKTLSFIIYDRWGEKVFETSELTNGWDGSFRGKPMEEAVFMYSLKAEFNDGTKVKNKGSISLLR